jgi:hypothetical protein
MKNQIADLETLRVCALWGDGMRVVLFSVIIIYNENLLLHIVI